MTKFKSEQMMQAFNHIYSFEPSSTQSYESSIIFSYQYENAYSFGQSKITSSKFINSSERQARQNAENAQRFQNAQNLLYLQQSQQSSQQIQPSHVMHSLAPSQFQQQSQQHSSIQDSSQSSMNTVISEVIAPFSPRDMSQKNLSVAIKSNANTRFLHEMKSIEKTFRIEGIVIRGNDEKSRLEKAICMNDQRFEMNVIFASLQQNLKLFRNELASIDFRELIMHTADHREISLIY